MGDFQEVVGSAAATTLHTLHASEEAIKVYVRVRPQLGRELSSEVSTQACGSQEVEVKSGHGIVRCKFDGVFGPGVGNSTVYDAVSECAQNFVKGFNSTCFAYGQTGSGKTYTMFGDDASGDLYSSNSSPEAAGIIPRAVRDVFAHMRKQSGKCSAYVSFLQIYNEKIFDLLRDPGRVNPLQVKEDALSGFYVDGLSEFGVTSAYDCLKLVKVGDDRRAVRSTNMNLLSSRSHTVFQMVMETRENENEDDGRVVKSKLNLVDLAGSEKWNVHEHLTGAHVSELTNINLSLHTLGRCIEALCLKSNGTSTYVPYRESKLTRLLQDSIGGSAKTCLLTMVSPSALNAEESVASLRFADNAKKIIQHVRITETRTVDMEMVSRLESEVLRLRTQLSKYEGTPIPRVVPSTENSTNNGFNVVASSAASTGGAVADSSPQSTPDRAARKRGSSNSEQQLQHYKSRCRDLEGIIDAVDKCVSRFFRFDIEEEQMQSEVKDLLSQAKRSRTSVSAPSSSSSSSAAGHTAVYNMPSPTANSARLGVGLPMRQADISNIKYRIRKKGKDNVPAAGAKASERTRGTPLSNMANKLPRNSPIAETTAWQVESDMSTTKLKKKLAETQKRIAKQRKLQEWQKKKAQREKEALEAKLEYEDAQRRAMEEAELIRRERAAKSKEKLEDWRRKQIDELNALLGRASPGE